MAPGGVLNPRAHHTCHPVQGLNQKTLSLSPCPPQLGVTHSRQCASYSASSFLSLLTSYLPTRLEQSLSLNTNSGTNLPTPGRLGTWLYKKGGSSATWFEWTSKHSDNYWNTRTCWARAHRPADFTDREHSPSTQRIGMELKAKEQVQQPEKARFTVGFFRVTETIYHHIAGVTEMTHRQTNRQMTGR